MSKILSSEHSRQTIQYGCNFPRFFNGRPTGHFHIDTHFCGDNAGQGSFSKARRAVKKHMVQSILAAIEKPGEIAAILNNLQEGDLLFVDEIHRLNRQVEEVLYPAMEDYCIDIMIGKGASG